MINIDMKIQEIEKIYTLYHGTCRENAERLLKDGWKPNRNSIGANFGQTRYLYLTNYKENALWFAEEKGCNTIVKVKVPESHLRVDPEDGIEETVEDELNNKIGLPGSVVLYKPLDHSNFEIITDE